MQIDAIKAADYIQGSKDSSLMPETVVKNHSKSEHSNQELRAISIDNSTYNKKGEKEEKITDKLEKAQGMGLTTSDDMKNAMLLSQDVVKEQEKDGFDPMDSEDNTIVTVTDKILMKMASVGVDISEYGGLSDDKITAMSANVGQAMLMKNELNETLTDENAKFLISNELEPTIENIYDATYKAPAVDSRAMNKEAAEKMVEEMAGQIEKLAEAIDDMEVPEVKQLSSELLAMELPVTKENIEYLKELKNYELPEDEAVYDAINDIILEGKEPKEAYLIKGYSLMDQAREIKSEIDNYEECGKYQLKDIQAKITLEEIRMTMTVEANFNILKSGVKLHLDDLQQIIDELRGQEKALLEKMLEGETLKATEDNVENYLDTFETVADISDSPDVFIGRFPEIRQVSLKEIHSEAISLRDKFIKANETYEAVGTAPRRDMGDSIKKAFNNIGDILEDIGMHQEESNEKAVRILAYNEMPITEENINKVKAADELVSRVIKNMTPAVVTHMIKAGHNPLNMSLLELKEETEAIKAEMGSSSDTEGFAKFLYKAEQNHQISDDERQAYIGIYRLIHQVEAADGAPIGALIAQGADVNLKNLMTAVRNEKHKGRDYKIDDKFGGLEELNIKDLSITEQIEVAFNLDRLKDAKEAMSPAKLAVFENEEQYLQLTPDQFATAMEAQDAEEEEILYRKFVSEQMEEALSSEEEVYRALQELDMPVTPRNLMAMTQLFAERNKAFKDLFKNVEKDDEVEIRDIIEQVMERFGEACKTPEEMAEAEEELGDLAENIMKNMLVEEDVTSIDVRGMKLVMTQISTFGQMAKDKETFNIPIMVADQTGNMTLKVVRGAQERGLLKLALSMQETGTVTGSFRYEKGELKGEINCDSQDERERIAANLQLLSDNMQKETGLPISMKVGLKARLDANDIYKQDDEASTSEDEDTILTSTLYSAAKSLINTLGSIL